MAARSAAAAQSIPDPSAQAQQTLVAPLEVADGDLVRCAIAPYLFLARASGGALVLEPVGIQSRNLDPKAKLTGARPGRPAG